MSMIPVFQSAGRTILIVDDTFVNLGVMAEELANRGFRVVTAEDGEEGMQRADFAQPDLILLDVMMPGLDGLEVCRRLKAFARTRHIPVIFMTALAEMENKVSGFDAGGVDYVTKPVQIDEAIARINLHLRLDALQKQLEAQNAQLQKYRERLEQQVAERTAELSESNRRLRQEITAREQYEELLHKREQEFRELVENSPDTIARYDRECRRIYANPRLITVMGGDPTQILGVTPTQVPGGASARKYENCLRQVFAQREECHIELRWQAGDREICTHIRMSPEFDLAGEVVQVLAVGRDITEIDRYRKKIHQQAFFDGLTGLPNRLLFSERMQQAIADTVRQGRQFCLMTLDLDNFKEVNDTLGHGVGDRLLCEMAARLQAAVCTGDTVARLGGDEFALLLPDTDDNQEEQSRTAVRILHLLAAPFTLEGREFVVTASIGIARCPADSTESDGLYKYADSAMYHAKKLGRNNFQFYAQELTTHASERLELDAALRKARRNGELELYYQPQVDMPTGRVIGAEALLRWNRPGYGMVMPDKFIPIAEASGLIVDIGEWVLATACDAAVAWNRRRTLPLGVAVNLSTRQFIRNDLPGTVARVLAETGCKPAWLKLEITESLLLDDSQAVMATLHRLTGMGLSIAIDDFGTGYSALSYLNRFPVSQLKIDRSFVSDVPDRRDKCELVKAMLSISTALHLEVVAEGVETPAQAEYLMAHGCRLAQGYLYGKPLTRTGFDAILQQAARKTAS